VVRPGLRPLGRTGLPISEVGFGAAPLGNLYAPVPDDEARSTLARAIDAGLAYIDTAPLYGFGLSERRVGDAVRAAAGVLVSTKVGRLLAPAEAQAGVRQGFASPMPFETRFDYSYDGVMRSWEDSLQRLGLAKVDILYIHDIGRLTHGDAHERHWNDLTRGGGLRALQALRAGGQVRAIGAGVNEIEVCLDLLGEAQLDVVLLAGRYTLLEQTALETLLPACAAAKVSIVVGGPYNSGVLATGVSAGAAARYDYAPPSREVVERVARLQVLCERHGVPLGAAALQFPLAHPQVVSVIPGLASERQVEETIERLSVSIPGELWRELKSEGLLSAEAPTPVSPAE